MRLPRLDLAPASGPQPIRRGRRAATIPVHERRRLLVMMLCLAAGFLVLLGQLARLATIGATAITSAQLEPLGRSTARPDIVDRNGRLLATDLATPSLFADPSRLLDVDEAVEKLHDALGLDADELRAALADRGKHFLWLRRGLTPAKAQEVYDLGLPGIGLRQELRRVYPAAESAGPILGFVDIDNRGVAGIERMIDQQGLSEAVDGPGRSSRAPVVLSIDLAVQHALRDELVRAMQRYGSRAAAGMVLDIRTGEVLGGASLPDYPAGDSAGSLEPKRADRLLAGTFELGSVFKIVTLAMGLDAGTATLDSTYDATQPISIGGHSIDDLHPTRRILTAEEVFLHSSNIGAARMAEAVGATRFKAFLERLGLSVPLTTELGAAAVPQLPKTWGRIHTMTISYGHGIAVAPLQFAAAVAGLFNGGVRLDPTFLKGDRRPVTGGVKPVVSSATVEAMRGLMRRNVTSGTGRKADVAGYRVGGKTGTADIASGGKYQGGVIASFLAVFPSDAPRYLTFVLLWEPKPTEAAGGQTTAGANAAPTTSAIIRRVGPILGLPPVAAGDGGT